jgi:polyferredoxin/Pyruvate/2-oxoacid:ferredoxin oxidoreductase delta subunit
LDPDLSARAWRRTRQVVQVLSLLVFLGLFIFSNAQRPQRFWADLFTRLDPLLVLASSLAGRAMVAGFVLAGFTLLLTLLFGRVWCGWLCPLGTLLEWIGPRRTRSKAPQETWRAAKYLLLVAILAAAVLGNLTLLVLDPITILNRTLATAAWPALRHAVVESEAFLYRFTFLWGPLDVIHKAIVQPMFQEVGPVFSLAPLVALLFVGLIVLNWWADRSWCRYLCPLGGMLGLLSKLSLVRREVTAGCTGCARCSHQCPTATIDPRDGYRSDPAECIVCFDCLPDCAGEGIGFRHRLRNWRPARWQPYDPSRRQALAVVGASVAGVALTGVEPISRRDPPTMIRPPGALLTDFDSLCVRCSACVRVCPTQGLQPILFQAGVQNLLTPRLVPRLGYCNYGCAACGQVCPTRAIPELALEEKQRTPVGLATIDQGRCLPWAYDVPCIVCEEVCPIPDKAVWLEEVSVEDAQGNVTLLQRPRVIRDLCIGCGICEYKCPVGGNAAIRVYVPAAVGGA